MSTTTLHGDFFVEFTFVNLFPTTCSYILLQHNASTIKKYGNIFSLAVYYNTCRALTTYISNFTAAIFSFNNSYNFV